jgi:anti-sigma factor RsiW
MNCREVDEMLGAWHDRELDPVRSREIEAHLAGCAACTASLRRIEALSGLIAEHASYFTAPPELRRKLAAPHPWFSRPVTWLPVLAAACVLAALAIWRIAPVPGSGALENEVVSAHVRSLLAAHLIDVPSSDRHTVKPWFAGKLDFAPEVPDLSAHGFELAGGRLDYLDGHTVAALVYRRRLHTINVFTWPSSGPGERPRAESRQGFHLLHWVSHGMNWWAVSDLAADELRQLPELL